MATSNSIDYSVTAADIIKGALRSIGQLETGETPSADEISDGLEALNLLCKQWTAPPNPVAPGLKMWLRKTASISLTLNQAYLELKSSGGDHDIDVPPVRIIRLALVDSNSYETDLLEMTQGEYDRLYSKGIDAGTITKWFYDRQLATGWIYFNNKPNDVTTYPSVKIRYHRTVEDFDAQTDSPDFPQEWYRPLRFNLAIDLAPEYGVDVNQTLFTIAKEALLLANSIQPQTVEDRSQDYFQPGRD